MKRTVQSLYAGLLRGFFVLAMGMPAFAGDIVANPMTGDDAGHFIAGAIILALFAGAILSLLGFTGKKTTKTNKKQ
jgi:hypothetical protein